MPLQTPNTAWRLSEYTRGKCEPLGGGGVGVKEYLYTKLQHYDLRVRYSFTGLLPVITAPFVFAPLLGGQQRSRSLKGPIINLGCNNTHTQNNLSCRQPPHPPPNIYQPRRDYFFLLLRQHIIRVSIVTENSGLSTQYLTLYTSRYSYP